MATDVGAEAAHPLHGCGEIGFRGHRRAPGESRRVAEVGVESRCSQERLGRYAAEVQAIAAEEVPFHQCHPGAEGGGASRGDQPGSAGAEDDEVVAGSGLRVLPVPPAACWPAARRRRRRSAAARSVTRCGRPRSSVARSQPSLAESRAAEAGHDRRTFAHQAPEEPRAVVLDHQGYRSLVEPVVLRGEPTAASPVAGVEAGVEAGQ